MGDIDVLEARKRALLAELRALAEEVENGRAALRRRPALLIEGERLGLSRAELGAAAGFGSPEALTIALRRARVSMNKEGLTPT